MALPFYADHCRGHRLCTKLVAIRMMFRPLEPMGIRPFVWQGVVPRRAERMAAIACGTMTERLISPTEIFSRLDPHRVAAELREPLLTAVEIITTEMMPSPVWPNR